MLKDLTLSNELSLSDKTLIIVLIKRSNLNPLKKLFLSRAILCGLTLRTRDKLKLCQIIQNRSLIKLELDKIELRSKIRRLKS